MFDTQNCKATRIDACTPQGMAGEFTTEGLAAGLITPPRRTGGGISNVASRANFFWPLPIKRASEHAQHDTNPRASYEYDSVTRVQKERARERERERERETHKERK